MSEEQKLIVQDLKPEEICTLSNEPENPLSFAAKVLKRVRISRDLDAAYIDTQFILPTCDVCERLFSKVGHALSNRRKRILPSNFEKQIFLHLNRDLWRVQGVKSLFEN